MQHHQHLSAQETHRHGPRGPQATLLVTFDLQLVPVAQEHGVYVVREVGSREQNVGVGQPVSAMEAKVFSVICSQTPRQTNRLMLANYDSALIISG